MAICNWYWYIWPKILVILASGKSRLWDMGHQQCHRSVSGDVCSHICYHSLCYRHFIISCRDNDGDNGIDNDEDHFMSHNHSPCYHHLIMKIWQYTFIFVPFILYPAFFLYLSLMKLTSMIMAIGNSDEEVSRKYRMIRSVYMLQCALDDFDDYQALIHNTQSQYTLTIYSHWYSLTLWTFEAIL